MKYLLIDGNNLGIRCAFANNGLTNSLQIPTGAHFGFSQSILGLIRKFPNYQVLVAWDKRSKRRTLEAAEGVQKGIRPSGYKENRDRGDDLPAPIAQFYEQMPFLRKGLGAMGIPQIQINDFEADDVIASYVYKLKENNEVVAVTSDQDYMQLLDDNVRIWDGMKLVFKTKKEWIADTNLEPSKAIDIGAFSGDDSDNIFGAPGWGDGTSTKEIVKHGSMDGIFKVYHGKYDKLRDQYPDLDNENDFKVIKDVKNDPKNSNSKNMFPQIYFEMPFTGVCKAFYEGKIKIPKKELTVLMFEDRIRLAYSLKKMDCDIPNLPEIINPHIDFKKIKEYIEFYEMYSLADEMEIVFSNII
jgi:DNA polymerase I